ncbi:MAG TPA: nitrogen regulation protein NR(I) [Chromatiaceae bacterium]|jgi:two-component system nitrogen regulation response regulator GlnG|nr:nitrogen regulation protein NR(I) [Chromatiaceae bacterium]HIN81574.1 nitrogen regulation protein NR(I) [Chromatiales bacterium]HIA07817.1 nitrogen regulation protein NR(I) [Chromatiaceae bacterium]HIB83783.1 nitrogen regulation protein NR(I) [Chromatiaceae bacterium]HIO13916.1 nitrogen regulation protein NR(I) [Chromatiales bacterium]
MTKRAEVWVVDDDRSIRFVLERALQKAGMKVAVFESAAELLAALDQSTPDVIVSDIRMPGMDGLELLDRINNDAPDVAVIIMTAHSDLDSAVSAFHGGAFEYLAKPFDLNDAVDLINRAAMQRSAADASVAEADISATSEIIGEAPSMQTVFRAIGRLSVSDITVLITGESGTGKELVARALHSHGQRSSQPFIALNMAAIAKDLLESELFGHERGAFTGAQSRRAGRFEQANGGTLFLDEIGDMPPELQTRLLRVLAEGEFFAVGGHSSIQVDVRIVAATHQDLQLLVEQGRFREDLYHRLNVIPVELPALRERREDIPLLARHFLASAAAELQVSVKSLDNSAAQAIAAWDFPGNVRELSNLCRRLTVMAPGQVIRLEDLPDTSTATSDAAVDDDWAAMLARWATEQLRAGHSELLDDATPTFERTLIEAALRHTQGRKQDAARILGWGRNTLTRKLKELNIDP